MVVCLFVFSNHFKRLQILGTIAGTFAGFYRKKNLAMLLFCYIFAIEKAKRDAILFYI